MSLLLLAPVPRAAGAASPGIMAGAYIPPIDNYRDSILSFDRATGTTHTHAMFFCKFDYDFSVYPYLCDQIRDAGKIPVITWQPCMNGQADPSFSYGSFLRGDHDAVIRKMARNCRDFGDTIIIRYAHEMNISCSSAWPGQPWNNRSAPDFIRMWRHVHDLFTDEGAGNVLWAWSPNYMGAAEGLDTYSNFNNLYPGDDYVDIVGVSGLNYGNHPNAGPGFSVSLQWLFLPILRDMMAGSYDETGGVRAALGALAAISEGKPQAIFEFGSVDTASSLPRATVSTIPKSDWIRQGYDALARTEEFSFVRLVLWYNGIATSGGYLSDFRVAQNPGLGEPPVAGAVTAAYHEALSAPGFLSAPLTLAQMAPGEYQTAPSLTGPEAYPQHEFWLSVRPEGAVRRGATVGAAYFLHPPLNVSPLNWGCDAYVWAELPNGESYAFVPPNKWMRFPQGGYPPATVRGFSVKREARGMAFAQPLGGGLPSGRYAVISALAPPGTDPRSGAPDLKTAVFMLTE